MKKNLSLLKYVSFIFYSYIFLLISIFSFSFYFVFNKLNEQLVTQKQSIVSELLVDSIKEPIAQGSYFEATQRLQKAVLSKQIKCFYATVPFEFRSCNESDLKNASQVQKKIKFAESESDLVDIKFFFEGDELILNPILFISINSALFFLSIFLISLFIRRLQRKLSSDIKEVYELSKREDLESSEGFNFQEYHEIGIRLQKLNKENQVAAKNQAILNMARQVAHDIRAPLNVLDEIIENSENDNSDESNELIGLATDRIRNIANKLLKASKSGMNIFESFSLPEVLGDVLKEKRVQFPKLNIQLQLASKRIDLLVKGNSYDFQSIMSNLIDNAIQAGSETIQISLFSETNLNVVLEVKDSGRGIPLHIQSQIFQHGFTYGKEDGNGLGLNYAKSWLVSLGGDLSFETEENAGTSFLLTIPKFK